MGALASPNFMGVDWNYFLYMSRSMPAKRKIISSLLHCNYRSFASKGQGPRDASFSTRITATDQLRLDRPDRGISGPANLDRCALPSAPPWIISTRSRRRASYIFREAFRAPERSSRCCGRSAKDSNVMILAGRARAFFWPRAVPCTARRYRKEISGDVCVFAIASARNGSSISELSPARRWRPSIRPLPPAGAIRPRARLMD